MTGDAVLSGEARIDCSVGADQDKAVRGDAARRELHHRTGIAGKGAARVRDLECGQNYDSEHQCQKSCCEMPAAKLGFQRGYTSGKVGMHGTS